MRHRFKNDSRPFRILLHLWGIYMQGIACNFDFTISHGGKSDATKHISTKKTY